MDTSMKTLTKILVIELIDLLALVSLTLWSIAGCSAPSGTFTAPSALETSQEVPCDRVVMNYSNIWALTQAGDQLAPADFGCEEWKTGDTICIYQGMEQEGEPMVSTAIEQVPSKEVVEYHYYEEVLQYEARTTGASWWKVD